MAVAGTTTRQQSIALKTVAFVERALIDYRYKGELIEAFGIKLE